MSDIRHQASVLGISKRLSPSTIAVELEGSIYAALQDSQGNICRLVNDNHTL